MAPKAEIICYLALCRKRLPTSALEVDDIRSPIYRRGERGSEKENALLTVERKPAFEHSTHVLFIIIIIIIIFKFFIMVKTHNIEKCTVLWHQAHPLCCAAVPATNLQYSFCLYEVDDSRHLREVDPYSVCLFVTIIFHSAQYFHGSPMYVSSLLFKTERYSTVCMYHVLFLHPSGDTWVTTPTRFTTSHGWYCLHKQETIL